MMRLQITALGGWECLGLVEHAFAYCQKPSSSYNYLGSYMVLLGFISIHALRMKNVYKMKGDFILLLFQTKKRFHCY